MARYQCPLCKALLTIDDDTKGYTCPQRHHFDRAKEGYLNLLPVQHKHSKAPGDNKEMLQARQVFLTAGYYDRLGMAMVDMLKQHCTEQEQFEMLDLGCGEGFYSRYLAAHLQKSTPAIYGVDIAKFAIAQAAKLLPIGHFAVASYLLLPYPENSFELIIRIFAPSNPEEITRVLKPNGWLLTVTPGPRHLWQLKALIYPEVREHPIVTEIDSHFKLIQRTNCAYSITPKREHRLALLQMTPFAWRANAETHQKLENAENLEIETDFIMTLTQFTG